MCVRSGGARDVFSYCIAHELPVIRESSVLRYVPERGDFFGFPRFLPILGAVKSTGFRMEAVNGVVEGGPPPPSPLTGCYLLIVIGEPHSQEHKDIILQRVAKGKQSIYLLNRLLPSRNKMRVRVILFHLMLLRRLCVYV